MKRFIANTIIYSCIIIALIGAGEWAIRRMPSSYSYKNQYISFNIGGGKIRVLILGSSHTYYGLRPDAMGADGVFNLANISQTPEYDLALLHHYLPAMPQLRRVIIPVSYFTYRDPRIEDGDEWGLAIRYKVDMNLPVHSDFSKYNLTVSDFSSFRARVKNIIRPLPSNRCDSLGFGLFYDLEHRSPYWESEGEAHARHHTIAGNGSRYDEVLKCQDSLISLCRRHDIEPIFITTPCWHTYRAHLDSAQLDEMYRGISHLVRVRGVRHFDFLADPSFTADDFYDPDHLSEVGAIRLSTKLMEQLRGHAMNMAQPRCEGSDQSTVSRKGPPRRIPCVRWDKCR